MAVWQPEIQVFDNRQIADNVLLFLKANQTDALKWANGDAAGLADIKSFYSSPRLVKVFPSLTVLQTEHSESVEDIITIKYSLVLEIAIQHGNQDTLANISKKYDMAVRSMLSNVPEITLENNSYIRLSAQISELNTSFDVLGKTTNSFLQVFQTRATWNIEASAY